MNKHYQYRPVKYFVLTFLTTFSLWFAGAYISFQAGKEGLYILLMLPGLMAPFIVSMAMIFTAKNSSLKKDFVNRLIRFKRIQLKTLPVFILLMPLSILLSIALSLPFGGSVSQFQFAEGFSFSTGFVPVLIVLLLAATFEELGWRGYAFDSLQSRHTYFTAAIVFSILWSLWHFPLIFVKGSYQYEILHQNIWFAVNFFASIIPMGVIISWVCTKNGKNIPAAILFHFIINISQEMLAISPTTKCIETVVLTVVAIGIIMMDKALFFSKEYPGKASEPLAQPQKSLFLP